MTGPQLEPSAERLFPRFLDPVDGTACFPASTTPSQLAAACSPHRLRFPLALAADVTLQDHLHAATHAPASCRFGPYCDNILGMNWQCPNGSLVRIGEQVAKTTTGYDWLRFLLHSGTRFGFPVDYVLRLRPECGSTQAAFLQGTPEELKQCLQKFLHSGWMHWWDAVDFLSESNRFQLRILYHAAPEETPVFAHRISEIARERNLEVSSESLAPGSADGIPDLVLKTTPDKAVDLAVRLTRDGDRCVALAYNGVVHAYFRDSSNAVSHAEKLGAALAPELEALGGDWRSRHLTASTPHPAEGEWLKVLHHALDTP